MCRLKVSIIEYSYTMPIDDNNISSLTSAFEYIVN